nr:unconventional prefoldin RPB5 interactor-like protein [Nomia melanderi]
MISEDKTQNFQRMLFDEAILKGIQQNEEQRKIWADYKKGHQKVAEALYEFRKDVHVNCMIPIGKRALMKGKLIHTNEVLASLGDGYFAKYTAEGAAALCERRIKRSEDMLKKLSTERDLYETKMMVIDNDVFEDCAGTEIVEHWNEEKIYDWKIKHREREKEYHQKLAKLRQEEKTKIETEEDLFHRLDQLELEEELADEFNRLEDEHYELFGEELEEYSSSDNEKENPEEEKEEQLEKEEQEEEEKQKQCKEEEHEDQHNKDEKGMQHKEKEKENQHKDKEEENQHKDKEEGRQYKKEEKEKQSEVEVKTYKIKKVVSFVNIDDENKQKVKKSTEEEGTSETVETEEDILRIEFSHSEYTPIAKSEGDTIETPGDIYRIFSKPKSILKRSPHDIPPVLATIPDYSTEEEEEDEENEHIVKASTYETVVKDIKERHTPAVIENVSKPEKETRPVSKFKRERQLKK